MHIVIQFLVGIKQVKFKLIRRTPTIEISKSRVPTKKTLNLGVFLGFRRHFKYSFNALKFVATIFNMVALFVFSNKILYT